MGWVEGHKLLAGRVWDTSGKDRFLRPQVIFTVAVERNSDPRAFAGCRLSVLIERMQVLLGFRVQGTALWKSSISGLQRLKVSHESLNKNCHTVVT